MRKAGFHPVFINDAFIPHLFHPARVQVWYGGSGSGKSDTKATELLLKCLTKPYCRVLFSRKHKEHIRDSQFLLFKDIISRYDLQEYFRVKEAEMDIVAIPTGNTLLSGGLDDVDKLKSIADITDIWIEEPMDKRGSVQSSDFSELNRRLRTSKASNHIHLTFNPITSESWIHDYFFKDNKYGANIVKTTYLDNHFAPQSEHEQYEILKQTKPDEYDVYALGNWGRLKRGLVFPEYQIVDKMPERPQKQGYGLDWGFYPDPTAFIHCAIYNGCLYLDEVIYQTGMTSETRAAAMKRAGVGMSTRIIADSIPEAIAEMKAKGFYNIIPAKKGPGSVKAGLDEMLFYKICITRRSTNIKAELDNYAWETDRHSEQPTGQPIDAFNHAIDAARYWLTSEAIKQTITINSTAR